MMLVLEFIGAIALISVLLIWNLFCALFISDLNVFPKFIRNITFIPPIGLMILAVPILFILSVAALYSIGLILILTLKQIPKVIYLFKQK